MVLRLAVFDAAVAKDKIPATRCLDSKRIEVHRNRISILVSVNKKDILRKEVLSRAPRSTLENQVIVRLEKRDLGGVVPVYLSGR